jgi:hypothetical protein
VLPLLLFGSIFVLKNKTMYTHKIAMVLLTDLPDWQKLNVAAFLASSVAVKFPETHGRPFITATGTQYLPFIKHPILIYKADSSNQIKRAFQRAKERVLQIGIYTRPLFATKNEEGNLEEIVKLSDDDQDLVGIIVYGENKSVDKAVKDLKFHP